MWKTGTEKSLYVTVNRMKTDLNLSKCSYLKGPGHLVSIKVTDLVSMLLKQSTVKMSLMYLQGKQKYQPITFSLLTMNATIVPAVTWVSVSEPGRICCTYITKRNVMKNRSNSERMKRHRLIRCLRLCLKNTSRFRQLVGRPMKQTAGIRTVSFTRSKRCSVALLGTNSNSF